MLKGRYKLGLVAALILVGAALAGSWQPAQAQAGQPCRIKHFACPSGMIDCCCGFRFRCFGTSAQCAAFCSVTLASTASEEGTAKLASCTEPARTADPAPESWQSFLAAQDDLPTPAAATAE